ncbi:MAG: amylo-alpha-1,6-glucosidase, partial [archaeon]
LWLPWGGLATIDKTNALYSPRYTGIDNRSYHRGDSWYWINNIAAIVMCRLDKKLFRSYIDGILKASVNDILYQGYIGHASELSDASSQNAQASFCQAWSDAMFIELIDELYS